MRGNGGKKLLLLGLDGGDLEYIRSRSDDLPTLRAALLSGRVFHPSPPRALSGSVWPTFFSGTGPGTHGLYQHLVWDPARMGLRRVGPDWCYRRPFWRDLEEQGYLVTALDVPFTFPISLDRGVEVTDWATHGQTHRCASNRPDIEALVRRFGTSPIGRELPIRKTGRQLEKIRRRLVESAGLKARLVSQLIRAREWDLFITVFAELHRGGHILWNDEDDGKPGEEPSALLQVHRAVDDALGRIIAEVGPDSTAILIFSVEGMARDHAQGHLVRPLMNRLNRVFLERHGVAPAPKRRMSAILPLLRRTVPARLQHAVGDLSSDAVRQWVVEHDVVGGIDWARTPGFALRTDIRTELRLNLIGREAAGMLEPSGPRHDEYVDLVSETFLALRDEDTGAQLVDDVVRIHDLFPGPNSDSLPDLVITWRAEPAARRVRSPSVGSLRASPYGIRGGDHRETGFAILLDAGAKAEELPPLEETAGFAGFVKGLLGVERAG